VRGILIRQHDDTEIVLGQPAIVRRDAEADAAVGISDGAVFDGLVQSEPVTGRLLARGVLGCTHLAEQCVADERLSADATGVAMKPDQAGEVQCRRDHSSGGEHRVDDAVSYRNAALRAVRCRIAGARRDARLVERRRRHAEGVEHVLARACGERFPAHRLHGRASEVNPLVRVLESLPWRELEPGVA
jgi:hypothetical protein